MVKTVPVLTIIGWLACGVGKLISSSSSVSGGGGRGGADSLGSGGLGGTLSGKPIPNIALFSRQNCLLSSLIDCLLSTCTHLDTQWIKNSSVPLVLTMCFFRSFKIDKYESNALDEVQRS